MTRQDDVQLTDSAIFFAPSSSGGGSSLRCRSDGKVEAGSISSLLVVWIQFGKSLLDNLVRIPIRSPHMFSGSSR
jgi:hypothetical protein